MTGAVTVPTIHTTIRPPSNPGRGGFLVHGGLSEEPELPTPTEAQTRRELIDPALTRAGWDLGDPDQVGFEILVDAVEPSAWHDLEARRRRLRSGAGAYAVDLPTGITDYALYRPDGDIVAVVEAKRTSTDPRLAQAQTEFYIQEIAKRQGFAPFAFMTNGHRIEFWDYGQANPRAVAGGTYGLEAILLRWHEALEEKRPVRAGFVGALLT